jgi:hypothetical protein
VAGTITLTVDGGTALTPLSLSIEAGALTLAGQGVGVSTGDWYDTLATWPTLGTALSSAADGDIIGIEGDNIDDYDPWVVSGNGGSVTYGATSGWDSQPGVTLVPPTADQTTVKILTGAGTNGTKAVVQLNVGYMLYIGPGWSPANSGGGPKWMGSNIEVSSVATGGTLVTGSRPMVFVGSDPGGTGLSAVCVTMGTVQMYQYPYNTDYFYPLGSGSDALYMGPSANHGAATPIIGNEWVYIEHEIDWSNNRGNAAGINRLHVWTSDRVIDGLVLERPLDSSAVWYWRSDFGLGGYWNNGVTRTTNDHVIFSHIRVCPNLAAGSVMGPPPGF